MIIQLMKVLPHCQKAHQIAQRVLIYFSQHTISIIYQLILFKSILLNRHSHQVMIPIQNLILLFKLSLIAELSNSSVPREGIAIEDEYSIWES